MAVQIAVIDDWQDVARDVLDWSVLEAIGEVDFIHDYPADNATLAARLNKYAVICVMRERTRFDEDLLRRLPQLKLLVTGGMRNAAIDLKAAAALGIQVSGTDSYKHAAPELTWALIMAATRNLVVEANALRAGKWQQGLGRPARQDPGDPGTGQHRSAGCPVWPGVRHAGHRLERKPDRRTRRRSRCDLRQQTGAVRAGRRALGAPGAQ